MLWREEQSAIAESMRTTGPTPGCIGFSVFVNDYEERYAVWFQRLVIDLQSNFSPPASADSERLARVQALLARLIMHLDVEKAYVKYENGQFIAPRWAQDGLRKGLDD